ncbi:hypothetical protein MASR2M8_21940 [Opitutaceae bacterium]
MLDALHRPRAEAEPVEEHDRLGFLGTQGLGSEAQGEEDKEETV